MYQQIEASWREVLKNEFESPYFNSLTAFILSEYEKYTVYPKKENIFRAFDLCKFYKIKIVIVGQDPYHGKDQANGLCFSVNSGIQPPPSLQNILKEVYANTLHASTTQNLENWATQGVLLLNSILTVRSGMPNSHSEKGWQKFTDAVISAISTKHINIIFLLWGSFAQTKESLIDKKKHFVLKTSHPSPFSAHKGFLGCGHFTKANDLLKKIGSNPIDW